MSETAKTQTTTRGMNWKVWPMNPGMKNMGMKATMLVITLKVRGIITSRTPAMAAWSAPIPCLRYR
jgi:hypothetical protein